MKLKVVMQNDEGFMDIILLYLRIPYVFMLKIDILNKVTMIINIHIDTKQSTFSFGVGQVLIQGKANLVLGSNTRS
jgi:hypothetical protein